MKMVVSYLNFVFFIEVKAKTQYRILILFLNLSKNRNGTLCTRIHQVCDTHSFVKNLTRTPSGLKNWHTSCKTFFYIICGYLDGIKN